MFHEGNGKVCTRVGQELGNSVGGAAGGGSEEMAKNRMAQGMPPGALRSGFWLQICLGARGVRDLLSGDRAEFGFPLAPAGSCAVFFQ